MLIPDPSGGLMEVDDYGNPMGTPNYYGGGQPGPAPAKYDANGKPIFSTWTQDEIDNHMRVMSAEQAWNQHQQNNPAYQQQLKTQQWQDATGQRVNQWRDVYNNTRTGLLNQARTALTEANALDQLPTITQRIDAALNPYRGYQEQGVGVFDTSPLTNLAKQDFVGDALQGVRGQRRESAYNQAFNQGAGLLASRGIGDMGDAFTREMQSVYNRTPLTSNDYSGVFDPNAVLDKLVGERRTNTRMANQQAYNKAFGGYDVNSVLGDTADDQYINDIVGTSFTESQAALDRARARGSLNDAGYQSAVGELGRQRGAANATAQTLGGAVLQRGRTQLGGILNEAKTGATDWDVGMQAYDPNRYATRFNEARNQFTSNLGGEIAGALSGQNFFDVGAALNKGGYAQGAQNTRALGSGFMTPAQAALLNVRDETDQGKRGLGGTSTF
jgi:hypothetical protein